MFILPNITAFLVREFVASVSGQGGIPPWPASTKLSRGVRNFCGSRPLRPPAALLHKAAFCKVVASRYAEAALGVGDRGRALTGLQNGTYAEWTSVGTGARPCGRCGAVASVSCFASVPVGGLRPVITCVPLPTHRGLAAARHWPPRAGCPSAPRGGSLNRAKAGPQTATRISRTSARASSVISGGTATGGAANARMICP